MARRIPLLVLVWLVSSLFYLGDPGKCSDDYFMAGRDPLTGAPFVAASPWTFPFS